MADQQHPDTKLTHAGRRKDWRGKLVSPAVHRGSTVLYDDVAEMRAARPGAGQPFYGLHGWPTQWALAEALTALEPGAAGTFLYPSGLAAVTSSLLAVLDSGDELLVTDSVYGPTRHFCDGQLKRLGITTRYFDPMATPVEMETMLSDRTRAILLESPGSLTFEVQDVPGICAMARPRGIVTLLDNTWATPLYFPALSKGVDVSIVAATKYIGGHADLLLGAATATEELYPRLERTSWDLGMAVSADDAWLAARGLRSMGVRLRRHEQSALEIARWLKDQPQVTRVLHPALVDCPGHALWKRDFTGSTGLFGFALQGGDGAARDALIDRLELFGIGYSWGGFESLAVPVDLEGSRTITAPAFGGPLVRLHIGLEDPQDLIADLAVALARYR
jgi:cystathionine beta-lyase